MLVLLLTLMPPTPPTLEDPCEWRLLLRDTWPAPWGSVEVLCAVGGGAAPLVLPGHLGGRTRAGGVLRLLLPLLLAAIGVLLLVP